MSESRAFGGAPRQTIINRLVCRQAYSFPYLIRQTNRSRDFLHPRLSSIFDTHSKKRNAPKRCVSLFGAGDESRTRRNQLGKLTPYRKATPAFFLIISLLKKIVNPFLCPFVKKSQPFPRVFSPRETRLSLFPFFRQDSIPLPSLQSGQIP